MEVFFLSLLIATNVCNILQRYLFYIQKYMMVLSFCVVEIFRLNKQIASVALSIVIRLSPFLPASHLKSKRLVFLFIIVNVKNILKPGHSSSTVVLLDARGD
jgi:hypothetical protein